MRFYIESRGNDYVPEGPVYKRARAIYISFDFFAL